MSANLQDGRVHAHRDGSLSEAHERDPASVLRRARRRGRSVRAERLETLERESFITRQNPTGSEGSIIT